MRYHGQHTGHLLALDAMSNEMQRGLLVITTCMLTVCLIGCNESSDVVSDGPVSEPLRLTGEVVEVSCGQCQFEMEGAGCELAIRHRGQRYFVEGSSIDDHGDAHAEDGLCNCVRSGKVTGQVVDDKFVAEHIELIDADAED